MKEPARSDSVEMDQPSEQALKQAILDLAPMLREQARQAERDRRPVDSVMQAIEATGAYKWFVPRRYGGYEFSLKGFMEVGLGLGEACTSTAWVTTFPYDNRYYRRAISKPSL